MSIRAFSSTSEQFTATLQAFNGKPETIYTFKTVTAPTNYGSGDFNQIMITRYAELGDEWKVSKEGVNRVRIGLGPKLCFTLTVPHLHSLTQIVR